MFPRVLDLDYLTQDPSVERWLRFKEERTKYLYLRVLRHFIDFAGPELGFKDPSGMVGWAKTRPDVLEVQDLVEKFGEAQSPTAQLVNMSIVRSLLKRNGVNLPSMGGRRPVLKQFHRGYSRQEVQSLLGFLDGKSQKLYLLFAKDSGLRSQDLLALRYRHVKRDFEAEEEYVHLALEPEFYNRRKASGITFIGPNSVKLLKELVAEKEVKTRPDSKIFPFSYPTITESLQIARRKANLDPLTQTNHGFRKFFENCLDRVGMDHHKKLQLEGHSQGVRLHYTDREIEDLRKLYQQAYQFLDLSEEAAAESRVKDLEKLVSDQTTQIKVLLEEKKGRNSEIEDIRAELRRIREDMEKKGK